MNEATTGAASRAVTKVPYRLTWADTFTGKFRDTKPGRGDAGWTVGTFVDAKAAARFVEQNPSAAMPCWRRFAIVDGELRVAS